MPQPRQYFEGIVLLVLEKEIWYLLTFLNLFLSRCTGFSLPKKRSSCAPRTIRYSHLHQRRFEHFSIHLSVNLCTFPCFHWYAYPLFAAFRVIRQLSDLFVVAQSLLDFVSAPVPFFMGVCSDKRVNQLTSEGVIVVDLDQNDILLPSDEILPSLPEVKGKKLLQALRKVSLWPAGQHTKDRCGGFRSGELSKMVTLEPLELSDAEIGHMIRHDEELCDKWAEVQALFSSFAARFAFCALDQRRLTTFELTVFLLVVT